MMRRILGGIVVGVGGIGVEVAAGASATGAVVGTPPHPTTNNITSVNQMTNPNNFP
jgi:hypothetical protein